MPTGTLPESGKKLWEEVHKKALEGSCKDAKDPEACAAGSAWTGVKNAGWYKDSSGQWKKKAELTEFSLTIVKASYDKATNTMRWLASLAAGDALRKVRTLVDKAARNHSWRQTECVNLIPSEQAASPMVRLLSVTDPAGRYAEHKAVKAFKEADVFYYQGTDFIAEVEQLLVSELKAYLECSEVEARTVSGQMANTAVFSGMVGHLNRTDRKAEQLRLRKVMNHHIIRGGHLSAQPMGALRDFVMRRAAGKSRLS